jgi:hypothetical protein
MKRETIIFTKSKHPFIHKLRYHTQGYIMLYTSFIQVVKMEPVYQKQNRHENLVLTPRVTYQLFVPSIDIPSTKCIRSIFNVQCMHSLSSQIIVTTITTV